MPLFEIAQPIYRIGGAGGGPSIPRTPSGGGGGGGSPRASSPSTRSSSSPSSTPSANRSSSSSSPTRSTGNNTSSPTSRNNAPSTGTNRTSSSSSSGSTPSTGTNPTRGNSTTNAASRGEAGGNNSSDNGSRTTTSESRLSNGGTRTNSTTTNENGSVRRETNTRFGDGTIENVTVGANGLTTRETSWSNGTTQRVSQSDTGATTTVTRFESGQERREVQTRLADGSSAVTRTTVMPDGETRTSVTIDRGDGRPSTVISRNQDGTFEVQTVRNGQQLTNPAGQSFTFDAQGVVTRTNADGSTTTVNTRTGSIIQQMTEQNLTATRNADGSVTTRRQEGDTITAETRDASGRLVQIQGQTVDAEGNVVTTQTVPDPRDGTKTLTETRTVRPDGSIQITLGDRAQTTLNPDGSMTLGTPSQALQAGASLMNGFNNLRTGLFGGAPAEQITTSFTVPPGGLPLNAEVRVGTETMTLAQAMNKSIAEGRAANPFASANPQALNSVAGFLDQTGLSLNSQFPAALAAGAVANGTREALSVPMIRQNVMQEFNSMHFGGRLGIVNNIVHNAGNRNPQRVFNRVTPQQLSQGIFQQTTAQFQQAGLPTGGGRPTQVRPISGAQLNQFINASQSLNIAPPANAPFNVQINQLTGNDLRSFANGQLPTTQDLRFVPSFRRQ